MSGQPFAWVTTAALALGIIALGCFRSSNVSVKQRGQDTSEALSEPSPEDDSPTALIRPKPQSVVAIAFHTRWNDANGNQTVNSKEELLTELEDLTTVFAPSDNICVSMFVLGLNGATLRCELLQDDDGPFWTN